MVLQATYGDENPSGVRPSGLPPGFCPARRAEARRQPRRAAPTWTLSGCFPEAYFGAPIPVKLSSAASRLRSGLSSSPLSFSLQPSTIRFPSA